MKVVIRVDASVEIGSGHVMRCLTFANMLKQVGGQVSFICRAYQGHLLDLIEIRGYATIRIESDISESVAIDEIKRLQPDLLIVDHYQLGLEWERAVKPFVKRLMVIDDLANRKHDCDLLIDQNFYANMETRYQSLVPERCLLLLGPKYLLLRPEFYQFQQKKIEGIKRLLIFFGGSDPTNETTKALQALKRINEKQLQVDVVVGQSNPCKDEVRSLTEEIDANYYCQINDLARLMAEADLSLGAGGATMWERCFVGLPSVVTVVADNQKISTEAAAEFGAIYSLGRHEDITSFTYEQVLKEFIEHPHRCKAFQTKGLELAGREKESNEQLHPLIKVIQNIGVNND